MHSAIQTRDSMIRQAAMLRAKLDKLGMPQDDRERRRVFKLRAKVNRLEWEIRNPRLPL